MASGRAGETHFGEARLRSGLKTRTRVIVCGEIVSDWADTLPSRGPWFATPGSDRPILNAFPLHNAGPAARQRISLANNAVKTRQRLREYPRQCGSLAPPTLGFGQPFAHRPFALSSTRPFRLPYLHPKPAITRSPRSTAAAKMNSSKVSANGSGKRI